MTRYPLHEPSAASPYRALYTSLRLHPLVPVLRALDFTLTPSPRQVVRGGQTSTEQCWFVDSRADAAQALQLQHSQGQAPVPFLAAYTAVENYAWLTHWQHTGGSCPAALGIVPAEPASLFLRLSSTAAPDLLAATAGEPACATTDPAQAAALLTCGFIPARQLRAADGAFLFAGTSLTFPALTLESIAPLFQHPQPAIVPPRVLPGYPAEQHPFLYAFAAALNVSQALAIMAAASRSPLLTKRATHGTRSAILPLALYDEDPAIRHKVNHHLAFS